MDTSQENLSIPLYNLMTFLFSNSLGSRNPSFDIGSNKRVSSADSEGETIRDGVPSWVPLCDSAVPTHVRPPSIPAATVESATVFARVVVWKGGDFFFAGGPQGGGAGEGAVAHT